MILIEILSPGSITSYLFNDEESLYKSVFTSIRLHFQECNSVGRLYKVTRVGYTPNPPLP